MISPLPTSSRHELTPMPSRTILGGRSWLYRGYPIHSNPAETLFTLGAYPAGLPGNWTNVGRVLIVRVLDA